MILDVACGSKMFWFSKDDDRVVFGDIRSENHILCDGRALEIHPDIQMSYEALPFRGGQFDMVVFDPPHLINGGDTSWMVKKYGRLPKDWKKNLSAGFSECFRVLKPGGFLIFKWNETQVRVSEILALMDQQPLFGHKSGKRSDTHWICFAKQELT